MSKKLTTEEFVEKSRLTQKVNYLYYKTDYKNNHTPVIITCLKHGDFEQIPRRHISGHGCKLCGIERVSTKQTYSNEKFINKSNNIHKNFYGYDKLNYKGSKNKVTIKCPIHGYFQQLAADHIRGCGCWQCSVDKAANEKRKSQSKVLSEFKNTHKDLYDYSDVIYKTTHIPVTIICKKHGKFNQSPANHINGAKCPNCRKSISKFETEWLNLIGITSRYKSLPEWTSKRVDGIDIENKIVYEYLGDYYHGNPIKYKKDEYNYTVKKTFGELYNETFKKFDKISSLGYIVKYIWEYDYKRFKDGIDKEMKIITYSKIQLSNQVDTSSNLD